MLSRAPDCGRHTDTNIRKLVSLPDLAGIGVPENSIQTSTLKYVIPKVSFCTF